MTALALRLAHRLCRFGRDRRGVSAVEFALLLPVMVALYLGSVEVSQGIATDRKVTLTAHALADLSTQFTNIADSDMANILNASSAIMAPYAVANLQAVVSQLAIDNNGNATVSWSDATSDGAARTPGSAVTVPSALATPNSYLILGEARYNYNPTFGYVLTGALTLKDQIYMQPRQSVCVQRNSAPC
jgi:Flp pilus assembly protein TadG